MAISYDILNNLKWCVLNPNNTLIDLEDAKFTNLYNGGWSTRPTHPPTISLSDTINYVLDKKSSFAVKQLGEFLKSQGVSLTDIDAVPNTALKDAITKASGAYLDGRIVQVTGQGTNVVMSQKVVTDNINDLSTRITTAQNTAQDGVNKANAAQNDADDAKNIANSKWSPQTTDGTGNIIRKSVTDDLSGRIDNVQTKSDQAHTLASNAIPNNKKTSVLGTSTDLVATQKLVSDVNVSLDKKIEESYKGSSTVIVSGFSSSDRLTKNVPHRPCFIKKTPSTVAIQKGTSLVTYSGKNILYKEDTSVSLIGSHVAGNDYVIYVDENGKLFSIIDKFESPATIPNGCFIVGGYHYGLIPENETITTGQFATSGKGMIWKQSDVDRIKGINEFSIWDIRFRAGGIISSPLSPRYNQLSNHGMVYDSTTNMWFAIYHCSTDVDKFGVSRSGTNIASGTVKPKIPSAFGGNGSSLYDNCNWWTANEMVTSQGGRLLYEYEFNNRAYGTTENKVAGGSSVTYPLTERIKGLTSRLGCEQVTGTHWYWGLESSFRSDGTSWSNKDASGGRGRPFTQGTYGVVKSIFGGKRGDDASSVGSRFVKWNNFPWISDWSIGVVSARDALIL